MTTAGVGLFLRIANTMLARRAACLSAQLAGRALASEPALHCARGAHGGRPDQDVHATTVLCVRKDGQASVGWAAGRRRRRCLPGLALNPASTCWPSKQVVLVADGQVTMGGTVVKPNVRKTRKIGEHVIGGFAGAAGGMGHANVCVGCFRLDARLAIPAAWFLACCRRHG